MIWRNPGHEFDDVAKIICDDNAEFYLWGAGNGCREFISRVGDEIRIGGILDSDSTRIGELFCGYPIVEANSIGDKKVIVTTSDYYQEIIDVLEENGLKRNEGYFLKKDFSAIYKLYKKNLLEIEWMNLIITDKCTLKCKDCITFAPFFTRACHLSFEEVKRDVDTAFNLFSHIDTYQVVGGEPMMHPQLEKIIEYIGSHYRKQMDVMLLTSNATLLPEDSFYELCKKYDMTIRLSDYGKSERFFKTQRIDEWVKKLNAYEIKYEIVGSGIWHDFGNPKVNAQHTREELIKLYQECDCVHSTIRNHRFYSCHRQAAAVWAGIEEEKKEDHLDLLGDRNDKTRIMEFYLKYCIRGWVTCCAACYGDGTIMINREVPAAEQME